MTDTSVRWVALLMLGALAAGGCARQRPTAAQTRTRPGSHSLQTAQAAARMQALVRLSDTLATTSNGLPGANDRQHRRLMSQVFTQLDEVLRVLHGPNAGAEFRQQLQTLDNSAEQLANEPQDFPSEPTIDIGLRAARDALSAIARAPYYQQSGLTPLFDKLAMQLNELDTIRGPLHQVVAGEAVGTTSQIVGKMADALSQQLAQENGAAALTPTTQPAMPTTEAAPTSEPASAASDK